MREVVWGADIVAFCSGVRNCYHGAFLDLLSARADDDSPSGPRPLFLDCWDVKVSDTDNGYITTAGGRNPAGMSLVNHETTAFDGFASLQKWCRKHHWQFVEGRTWAQNRPYSRSEIPPMALLSRLLGYTS